MAERYLKFKGFRDVHVHFRDPGMPIAETRRSGAAAAAAGGFTCVTTMPNTTPAGDSVAWLREQIEDTSLPVRIAPSACISKGRLGKEIADLERLAEAGAVAFTDDGSFVDDENLMREAMRRAAALGKPVMQHAVVPSILGAGVIRDCAVARKYGLPVMAPEAETEAVRRDIRLCRDTGCALHIQHISCAGTVEQIRAAQKEGLPVTGEATPHHILFSCEDIPDNDANWKMAPPLGNADDRAAIRAAVKDGTLGIFATDHAPHPFASKQGGFIGTANGIIGLEVAVAVTYHVMVEQEGMDVNEWAKRWTEGPARLIGEEPDGETVLDLQANRTVDADTFRSLSRNMPYMGLRFSAWPFRRSVDIWRLPPVILCYNRRHENNTCLNSSRGVGHGRRQ
jgi:dihydroorotase